MAIVIVGTGILATLNLFATCTQQNRNSQRMSIGILLANHIHEGFARKSIRYADPQNPTNFGLESGETLSKPDKLNDIDDFNGASFNPPRDASFQPVTGLDLYTQVITVEPLNATDLTKVETPPAGSMAPAKRVTVRILYNDRGNQTEVYRAFWVQSPE